MSKIENVKIIAVSLFALLSVFSCSMTGFVADNSITNSTVGPVSKSDAALVTVSVSGSRSWDVSQYVLIASCEGYQTKTVVSSNSVIAISLGEGDWTLSVEGKDSDGNIIYKGTGVINITEEDSQLTVNIGLIKNAGNLKINLSNIPASVDSAVLTLTRVGFADVTKTISDISAPSIIAQILVNGDWALNVKGYDGGSQVYTNDFSVTVVTGIVTTENISL